MPRIMGSECVKVVKQNFRLQGYDSGQGVDTWKSRDPKTDAAYDKGKTKGKDGKLSKYRSGKNKNYKGSVYQSSNPLLLQTRNLFNSVKSVIIGKTVNIGVDLGLIPYAQKMNEQRKFIPTDHANKKMMDAIAKKVNSERNKALKDFQK